MKMNTNFTLPPTRYSESDGLSIAYQVFGEGATDMLIVPGIISHLDADWEDPAHARLRRHLAQHFRVIVFDKRGQGLSDRFEGAPTLEQRMDDVRAVMHAAGSRKAVLFAQSDGGAMGLLFTATHPAAVERLVLWGTAARFSSAPDYPHRPPLDLSLKRIAEIWGTPAAVALFAPSRVDDADYCERMARYMRQVASPSAVCRLVELNGLIDVRPILPQIRRPTLILQRRGDRSMSCANGRYLADHMRAAIYTELPGEDHLAWEGDADAVVDAIVHFAGATALPRADEGEERFVATVLFTDIVGSTELAAKLGDGRWRELLQRFHAIGRHQLPAFRGREIDTAGDGLFARFDGPARGIRCAAAIVREAQALGIHLRAGLHTGEVEPTADKVSGMAVHIGARVMAQAGADEVWVSSTTRDLVAGSGILFDDRGSHTLKGVPGQWHLWCALDAAAG
jgi:pimeloyl-ACP methyl ester carboxylesterase